MLNPCRLCPRECGVKRLEGETGECGAGKHVHISGYGAHFGEESPWWAGEARGQYFLPFAAFAVCSAKISKSAGERTITGSACMI